MYPKSNIGQQVSVITKNWFNGYAKRLHRWVTRASAITQSEQTALILIQKLHRQELVISKYPLVYRKPAPPAAIRLTLSAVKAKPTPTGRD